MEKCDCGVCGAPERKEVLGGKIYECSYCDALENKEGQPLKEAEVLRIVAEEFKDVITKKDLEELKEGLEKTNRGAPNICKKNSGFNKKLEQLKERQVEKGFSKKDY